MLFSSIPFLYYFLPCVVILYLLAPKPAKNSVLLLASLVFYAWGEKKLVVLMIAAILLSYIFGLLIEKYKDRKNLSRLFLILSVVTSLAMLFYYKYTDFFIYNFNAITGLSVPLLKIALPIGISFYTFQCLSYTVDVYRGDVPAQKNFIALATYVALFPQLIAGPIVRYSDVALQLNERTHSFEKVSYGIRRFVIGLSKKILIADALGELCDIFKSSGDKSVLFFWLYAIAFTLHIYFDFSGYSDMAIGLGKMFGFDFLENFNYPYISKSATEFWRRWHMSLGSWFRDYIYIPLGGNRVSKLGHIRNIFIVWFATGFWHGAAWNFIIWGLYFGVILVVEKFWLMKYLKKSKVWSHIYLLFTVVISFVIFNAADMAEAFRYIGGMFGIGGYSLVSAESVYYLRSYGFLFILGFIGSTPLLKNLTAKIREKSLTAEKILNVAEPIVMVVLLVVVTAFPVYGSFSPFLYFRF
ncbi:MAG: MBOAT family protein [Clostridia bacterium]|nr:MBOAT family protein [Clostridia bacterium]